MSYFLARHLELFPELTHILRPTKYPRCCRRGSVRPVRLNCVCFHLEQTVMVGLFRERGQWLTSAGELSKPCTLFPSPTQQNT